MPIKNENVEMNMICTDGDGQKVVIDRLIDHKHVEVAVFDERGTVIYEGDKARIDDLDFTGDFHGKPAVNLAN